MKTRSTKLTKARIAKKDEFYTQLIDIENELTHYKNHFKGKKIFMNADNPKYSQFWKYFKDNFNELGLLSITATYFVENDVSCRTDYDGKNEKITSLQGNGDFRSNEIIQILKEMDIIVTNPPFSLFKDLISQLQMFKKHFILIGNQNALTQKLLWHLIQQNKVWLGKGFKGNVAYFYNNCYDNYAKSGKHREGMIRVSGVFWYTNLTLNDGRKPLKLTELYNPIDYPKYDNYNAINVDRVNKIPKDYFGEVGVPITFMNKYVKEQFKIIGLDSYLPNGPRTRLSINGKFKYARIIIKRNNEDSPT